MADCSVTILPECWAIPEFNELKGVFEFAKKLARGCSLPAGRANMLEISSCNNKQVDKFHSCFDLSAVDHMLDFGASGTNNFSQFCWYVIICLCVYQVKKTRKQTQSFLITAIII